MQRKFIEYDLPLAAISKEAAHEKNVHIGLPPQFHLWWARKPLASTRATALATLLSDPGSEYQKEREEIINLIEDISNWKIAKKNSSEEMKAAQQLIQKEYSNKPKILDSFAGGGSIPLEVSNLGVDSHFGDYNPVAVLIEKATVEWPQKYGVEVELPEDMQNEKNSDSLSFDSRRGKNNILLFMVERWGNKLLDKSIKEVGQFYPKEKGSALMGKSEASKKDGWVPVGYYYNRTIPCQNPTCEAKITLTSNFWLTKKDDKRLAYRPVVNNEKDEIDFELLGGKELETAIDNGFDPGAGTVSRGDATCPVCGQVTETENIRKLAKEEKMGHRMVAVVFYHPNESGKRYRLANEEDLNNFKEARHYLKKKRKEWPYMESPLPDEKPDTDDHAVNRLPMYGMEHWKDIFNSRQKLALITLVKNLRTSFEEITEEVKKILNTNNQVEVEEQSLSRAIIGYLGLLLTSQVDFTSTFSYWHTSAELCTKAFVRQALQMNWNYFEVNPFSGSTGSFDTQLSYVLKSMKNFNFDAKSSTKCFRSDATNLPYERDFFDVIITDPPYYEDVSYAALSDFYYVWLKRAIGDYFPELFSTPVVPKSEEAIMEPTRYENRLEAKNFFEKKLVKSFQEMHRVLKSGGVATIIYAYNDTEGWETMLNGLIETGFVVTASWPIHSEMKSRLGAAHSASLASSIYMVCRKKERESLGFWKELKPRIQKKVEEKLNQFWKEGIVGGDLFISAIGPGMEIFSRYEEVQDYTGEKVPTLELLTFIRSITTDFVVNRLLQEASPSEIDKESQFYLAYRWTYLDNKVEYDAARKIASGMGVDIEELDENYGFVKKTRKYVRVYGPNDRTDYDGNIDEIEAKSMVDAMHKSLLLWEDGRKEEINELLADTGYAEQGSFWQFCQAVSESLVQGNDEKKKLEGFLMGRNKYVQSVKEMNEQDEETKDLFE